MRVEWLHTVLINTDDGGAWGNSAREKHPCSSPTESWVSEWQRERACVCVRDGNNDGNTAAQKEKLTCLVASVSFFFLLFLIKCVHATCVCMCVCVCKCNHSDFLFPIMALIHQLAVAMVFLSPPNQRRAREHAQRGTITSQLQRHSLIRRTKGWRKCWLEKSITDHQLHTSRLPHTI